ncbi:MAG: PilC/PilY family type IV pilus protein [Betaproteobacteria bacterium]
MISTRPSLFRKFCVAAVAASLTLQPLGVAAVTITMSNLAESPLQGLNPVKPNIMFTVDDSGSMGWDYLPDWTVWNSYGLFYCRDNRPCGGQFANGAIAINVGSLPYTGLYTPYTDIDPPLRSSDFNTAFYNPVATYNSGKRDVGTDLPCEGTNTACSGPWTSVYMDAYIGYPNANTGGTINLAPTSTVNCISPATAALCVPTSTPSTTGPWPGVPDTIWCRNTSSGLTGADYQTADGNGSVCRRNGRGYSQTTISKVTTPAISAGYNYPNAVGTTCASGVTCQFTRPITTYGYPYYYKIAGVWFCSGNAKGFGTTGCGTRQDFTSASYVRYSASMNGGAPGLDPAAFTRVDIVPSSLSGTGFLVNGIPATNPSGTGRSYAQEMSSFAKWYSFYRTRILAMKTAGGIAFSALSDDDARIGLHTLRLGYVNPNAGDFTYVPNTNVNGNAFLNVTPFDAANKAVWFNNFYGIKVYGGTPLPDAVYRIGEYFSNSGKSGLPAVKDPLDSATGRCQPNYHLLSTDGYWNNPLAMGNVGDQDKTVPALPGPVAGLTPGSQFPRPYYEGPTNSTNTLADLSMYYWSRDVRPTLPDNVKDTVAPWQHVTLYGLSIGAQGNIVYPTGLDAITAGTANWPVATGAGGPESIDDLWHAALNSRGKFFNTKNAQQLAEAIVSSLADFTDQTGTGTAVGIAGAQFSATKTYGYRTSYESGWWGDIKKYALDPTTGALPIDSAGNPLNAPLWSAATQVDAQTAVAGWNTNRRILTINDATNAVVAFHDVNQLSAAQQASLVAGWTVVSPTPSAQSVLNYLRGDPSNEGVGTTNFRVRSHILGDIVYSGAVPVGAPSQPYSDSGNPGYSGFVTAQKNRTPMLYVGGSDAMLHAFNDSTTTDAGKEAWAYVPKAMFTAGDPNDTAHAPAPSPDDFRLGALSYRRGGIPLFRHKFRVNATPRIWDVDFANMNTRTPPPSGNDWHTLLVGGLGAGGRAVYALDVTTPVALTDTEASVASSGRVLWEFTDANLGYVFDAPTLVKTYRYGWVALVASGYNNPGGKGILYVLNPKDGAILKQLSTGIGTDADPSGLSTIRAFVPSRKDPYALQAYGGDLKGNVWRFDLSDPDERNWKVERVAKLTDAGGNAQPITTGVRIEIDQNNNLDRYLFVGTGKLLGKDDIADATVGNTLYVIRDGTVKVPEAAPSTPYSRADLNSVDGTKVSGFTGTPTGRGWYQDGADKSWKIGVDVYADVQTVVYAFSKPATDPCERPLSSTLYARDLNTGNSVLIEPGGTVVSGIDIGAGIAGVSLIQGQGGSTGNVSSGDVRVQVTTMKGQVFSFGVKLATSANLKHRVSWRLLNRD